VQIYEFLKFLPKKAAAAAVAVAARQCQGCHAHLWNDHRLLKLINQSFILCIILQGLSSPNQDYLNMIFFNDKVSPANISFLTRNG